MDRRGFLKLVGAAVPAIYAARAVAVYDYAAAPTAKLEPWIKDRGAWYEIYIPEGKTMAKEMFDKPCLIIAESRSAILDCSFYGFVDMAAKEHRFSGNLIDCSGKVFAKPRALLTLRESENTEISYCHLLGGDAPRFTTFDFKLIEATPGIQLRLSSE